MPKPRKAPTLDDEEELTAQAKADIAEGQRDRAAGRVYTTAQVLRELGLDEAEFKRRVAASRERRTEASRKRAKQTRLALTPRKALYRTTGLAE